MHCFLLVGMVVYLDKQTALNIGNCAGFVPSAAVVAALHPNLEALKKEITF
jgi:hypothetical protein